MRFERSGIEVIDLGIMLVEYGEKNDPERLRKLAAVEYEEGFYCEDKDFPRMGRWREGHCQSHLFLIRFRENTAKDFFPRLEWIKMLGFKPAGFPHLVAMSRDPETIKFLQKEKMSHVYAADPDSKIRFGKYEYLPRYNVYREEFSIFDPTAEVALVEMK